MEYQYRLNTTTEQCLNSSCATTHKTFLCRNCSIFLQINYCWLLLNGEMIEWHWASHLSTFPNRQYAIADPFIYLIKTAVILSTFRVLFVCMCVRVSAPVCLCELPCRSWRQFERKTLSSASWSLQRPPPLWRAEPAGAWRTSGRVPPLFHWEGLCSSPTSQQCCIPPVRITNRLTLPVYIV